MVDAATTRIRFAALSQEEIDAYVASGEPMDKAGAYAIQGLASKFIERVEGCYFNMVGLPIALVYRHLKSTLGSPGHAGCHGEIQQRQAEVQKLQAAELDAVRERTLAHEKWSQKKVVRRFRPAHGRDDR